MDVASGIALWIRYVHSCDAYYFPTHMKSSTIDEGKLEGAAEQSGVARVTFVKE